MKPNSMKFTAVYSKKIVDFLTILSADAQQFILTLQLTAGMCAAKALVQYLCRRFNDLDSLNVFIIIA